MASSMKDLGIDRLSLDERLDLMHEIWESVSGESGCGMLNDAQKRELKNRLAEHIASPDDVVAWEQVRAEAIERSLQ
jgi:putative addiction module component (TIGR02574 family)